jgi:hypothetical protein
MRTAALFQGELDFADLSQNAVSNQIATGEGVFSATTNLQFRFGFL